MLTHHYGILGSITLLFTSAVFAATTNDTDPCAAIAGQKTANFQDAKACLDHFKFDKDIAQRTVDTVKKVTKDLYVFNVRNNIPTKTYTHIQTHYIYIYRKLLLLHLPYQD